ncbi:MAG: arylsulfatase, partial [bacterium]
MKRPDRRKPAGYAALRQNDAVPQPEFPVRVDRDTYPAPEYEFPHADVGATYASSAPDAARPSMAPDGSPNVLIVLLDDIGYGVLSTFGGLVASPALDRLAKGGLRYCSFHTAGLSSPTRAALLTGRNHHTVGAGAGQDYTAGYAGYHGALPKSCATIAELLRQNGYATGWWGKHHNLPAAESSAAGPFSRWPVGLGADYFYGFLGDATDRFHPAVYRNTTALDPARASEPGYHLTTDLANDCIAWIREQKAVAPARPFFAYFTPGCGHAPHQPPLDWRGRHAGKFDFGWDEYQRRAYERQLELGVIPRTTRLTERPRELGGWDDAGEAQRRLFTRLFENYADYAEHADFEVGRIVDALAEISELENTLIFYIAGDNGCSAEGGSTGTLNDAYTANGFSDSVDDLLPRIDAIGTSGTSPNIPSAWAWAGNTPFRWTKGAASHLGATRVPLVVHWPLRVRSAGETRFQFHHVVDVTPTILEVVGIKQPSTVNGVPQRPIEGVSMAYTFAADGAPAERRRRIQYFEAFGNRALHADGWIAACRHVSSAFDDDRWELYHVAE